MIDSDKDLRFCVRVFTKFVKNYWETPNPSDVYVVTVILGETAKDLPNIILSIKIAYGEATVNAWVNTIVNCLLILLQAMFTLLSLHIMVDEKDIWLVPLPNVIVILSPIDIGTENWTLIV